MTRREKRIKYANELRAKNGTSHLYPNDIELTATESIDYLRAEFGRLWIAIKQAIKDILHLD